MRSPASRLRQRITARARPAEGLCQVRASEPIDAVPAPIAARLARPRLCRALERIGRKSHRVPHTPPYNPVGGEFSIALPTALK